MKRGWLRLEGPETKDFPTPEDNDHFKDSYGKNKVRESDKEICVRSTVYQEFWGTLCILIMKVK